MKNNSWNIQMEVEVDEFHKKVFQDWYSKIHQVNSNKRYEFVKDNPLPYDTAEYIKSLYNEGYGYRIISRVLDISYTQCRRLLNVYIGMKTRKGLNVVTEKTREFRKQRVSGIRSPFYEWPTKRPFLSKRSETGLQGYYIKKNGNPIWLRSSWEYIFAKWLDNNNIEWVCSTNSYRISENETYNPDFYIYQDDECFFVEIKGTRYQHRLYKVEWFREQYPNYKIAVIDDITPFIPKGSTYKEQLELWRKEKLSKKELLKRK